MNQKNPTSRLIFSMGVAFLLFLTWAVLWKCGAPFIGSSAQRTINLIPFNGNTVWELRFNAAIFIPLGFYLSAIKPQWSLLKRTLAVLLTSLVLEVLQFVLAVGHSDVTDLIMNTLGGVVGIAEFCAVSKVFDKNARKVTFAACVLLTLLEIYMALSFIIFGQLNIGFMRIKL